MRQFPRGSPRTVTEKSSRPPEHVAIIMDGNGRWAEARGHMRPIGHREGSESVRRVTRACRRRGVRALTLYAFSEQNWDRSPIEVAALMELLRDFLLSERRELLDHGIRLRAVGRTHRLPRHVRDVLDDLVRDTASGSDMTLTLALSYGGREELVDATRALAQRVAAGSLAPDAIDEQILRASLPSLEVGDVDLLIRTGGEQRISNFLLFGAAYAELYFTSRLWPDFDEDDLEAAFASYAQRDRRFGRVAASPARRAHV
jgi:undecaprenyl diphosphate synthase